MPEPSCKTCGAAIAPGASVDGLCPRCLIAAGTHDSHPPGVSRMTTLPTPPGAAEAEDAAEPFDRAELERLFPQLEILRLLGHGGMGVVYLVRQRNLDRLAALKLLSPRAGTDPAFADRFTREARALARLNHPGIVGIYDFGSVEGHYYFLMEYVDGTSLRASIQAHALTPAQALAVVPPICDALQYAHEEGIIHRDIKPENILLDRRRRVKIADFGLARILGQESEGFRLTGTQHILGTAHYMAPEQLERPKEVDHRADIYSLGVVFYEMLTGELPLGRFDPPSRTVQVTVKLDEVVLKALEKAPARRYQRASEVRIDVERVTLPESGESAAAAPTGAHTDPALLRQARIGLYQAVHAHTVQQELALLERRIHQAKVVLPAALVLFWHPSATFVLRLNAEVALYMSLLAETVAFLWSARWKPGGSPLLTVPREGPVLAGMKKVPRGYNSRDDFYAVRAKMLRKPLQRERSPLEISSVVVLVYLLLSMATWKLSHGLREFMLMTLFVYLVVPALLGKLILAETPARRLAQTASFLQNAVAILVSLAILGLLPLTRKLGVTLAEDDPLLIPKQANGDSRIVRV